MSDNQNNDEIEIVEIVAGAEDENGNVVVDDLVAAVAADGTVIATDETVTVATADGDIIVDEVVSVIGEDGELHAVEEEITVIEAEEA
jgi:hypothetical protein